MPKPEKPHKSFPLTPHVRGGWAKKYKGPNGKWHQLYIAESDPTKALKRFHRLAHRIDNGEDVTAPTVHMDDAKVYDVANRYVVERQADRDAGHLSDGAWRDYRDAANEMCDCFGEDTPVEDLCPDDFTRLYRKLDKRLKAHAIGRMVQSCRTIWKHAEDNNWIRRRPRYGSIFRKPVTEKKQGEGYTVERARALVASAVGSQVEAMLLLMLNGGYTAKDCAVLPRKAVDFKRGIIRFPRPKMKGRRPVDRIMTMWPETAEALAEVMASRPCDALVFRTVHGNPWVRGQTDSVALIFGRITDDLGWDDAGGPSWLRHLHHTLAAELEKPLAAARLMGHRLPGLAEVYVDNIEHGRIQQITDHVRLRIWPAAPAHPAPSETSPPRAAV